MNLHERKISVLEWLAVALVAALGFSPAASAQDYGTPSGYEAAHPEPPRPPVPQVRQDAVEFAGVGSGVSYARAGVVELGGSAGFVHAGDTTNLSITPTFGYFLVDNVEISALLGLVWNHNGSSLAGEDKNTTSFNILAEPSYHVPFNRVVFGFVGLGLGVQYADGSDTGFAISPRVGLDVMVGRSGVFKPSVSYTFYTTEVSAPSAGTTLVGFKSAIAVNAGYSVMW